jgi:predicted nucleic acid-binding protein
VILLDTTVLSNFARAGRLDLLRLALPEATTTPLVLAELQCGVSAGYFPAGSWEWLGVTELAAQEEAHLSRLRTILGDGEAACVAVLMERTGILFSDDLLARREAHRRGIPVSGTLGILLSLVKAGRLSLDEADACLQEMIAHGYRSPTRSLPPLHPAGPVPDPAKGEPSS